MWFKIKSICTGWGFRFVDLVDENNINAWKAACWSKACLQLKKNVVNRSNGVMWSIFRWWSVFENEMGPELVFLLWRFISYFLPPFLLFVGFSIWFSSGCWILQGENWESTCRAWAEPKQEECSRKSTRAFITKRDGNVVNPAIGTSFDSLDEAY